jgi:hypothetical protein
MDEQTQSMISRKRYSALGAMVFSLFILFSLHQPSMAQRTTACKGTAEVVFVDFKVFGVVHLQVRHTYPSRLTLSDFQINWIQRFPGVLTLHQIVAQNSVGQPHSVVLWTTGSFVEDSTPPTLARSEGTWVQSYTFPPALYGKTSVSDLYLDFDGITGLPSDLGITPADFNGTRFTFTPFCYRTAFARLSVVRAN